MELKLLGKLNFRWVLYFGIIEVIVTIILCYVLAVALGHKPAWLPTISECGEEPPEKHFFRWGIMVGGLLLMIEAVMLHNAKHLSTVGYWLGLIAGFCLTGVAVVASNEYRDVHLVFALTFFGLEDVMVLMMLFENHSTYSFKSKAIKIPAAILACTATVARFLIAYGALKFSSEIDMILVAVVEWINVIALLSYHLTLSDELEHLYIAELEEESEEASSTGKDKIKKILL